METMTTDKGRVALFLGHDVMVHTTSDFLDMLANAGSDTVAVRGDSLHPDFFNLETGLAGEMLQKASTYRKRVIILGEFREIPRKSLRDFVRESNSTGKVVFASDINEAIGMLR